MVLISLQVRETVRSRALFLCSFVFSLVVRLQDPESRVTRLLQVDVLRARWRWTWTRTSVYRHYSRARCTGRRAPAEENSKDDREERKTMMYRDKKKEDLERERTCMCLVMI